MATLPNASIEAIEAAFAASQRPGAQEQVHHFHCTLADFKRLGLEDRLSDRRGLHDLTLNTHKETLSFLTSQTHMWCMPRTWFHSWVFDLQRSHPELKDIMGTCGGWSHCIFGGRYEDSGMDTYAEFYSEKMNLLPTIVFEVGYTKSYDDLVDDATLLLEGAQGQIDTVIILKMEPLKEGETSLQHAFIELWKIDKEDMTARIYGGRLQLYPIPRHHACQEIAFSWHDLLGNQSSRIAPKEDPTPLKLDDLRDHLDWAVKRQLRFG